MELQDFCRLLLSGLTFLSSWQLGVGQTPFPLQGKQCTNKQDIPIIKVTSYTTVIPLEDSSSNNIIYSRYSMSKRLLHKESRPIRNVSVEAMDLCLGEGGLMEWSIPPSNRSAFVTEVVIECFDQGLGPVEFEYSGIGDFQVGNREEMPPNTYGNRTAKHLYMPTSYKLVFRNLSDQISGNYSCRSEDHPEKVNFFHLYAPMGGKPYLIQRGKTINVTQEEGSSLVTLPCIANNPKAKVFLFKKYVIARMGLIIVKYQHQPFHIYDPKTGFVIDTSDRGGVDPFGTYVCTSNPDIRDPSDRIRINLLSPTGVSRKSDGYHPPSVFNVGSQFVKNSYKRFRDLVNSFFI